MGKIKGWERKKLPTGRILYLSEKLALGIQYSPRGIATTPWVVDIMDRTQHSKIIILKYFRTKAQAQAYAVRYMKAHPRG